MMVDSTFNLTNYLTALVMLHIWDPAKYSFIRDDNRRKRVQLAVSTKGIVLHDRALNGLK